MVRTRLSYALAAGLLAALGVVLAAYLMGRDWRQLPLPSSWVLIGVFVLVAAWLPSWRAGPP